jgi:hypothetical protein
LIEAIRYGERPEVQGPPDPGCRRGLRPASQLQDLLEERALVREIMDTSLGVRRVRDDMERAEARRLQPHYIESFFLEAFRRLGGTLCGSESRGATK